MDGRETGEDRDDTRLRAADDTVVRPDDTVVVSHDTVLSPGDTVLSAHDTILSPGTTVRRDEDTVLIDEATVAVGRTVVDDPTDVVVTVRPRVQRSPETSPAIRVPGGEEFSLHRPIVVGRRPVTPLPPTESVLLLTWDAADTEVSGTHVMFEPSASGVVVTDLGSSNGTRVHLRGRPVRRLGPRESCLVPGEATVEMGRNGKIDIVPA